MSKPVPANDSLTETRDEVIRALLDPERDVADEVGRTAEDVPGGEPAPHASPREQAAAPINIQRVDE
jgi:hypothetical protein